jgi:two-component system LytT family response regulator
MHAHERARIEPSLRELEGRLDPGTFVRVHRSAAVNLDFVEKLEPHVHGQYVITMRGGSRVTSSRRHGARLREVLKK